MQLAIKKSPFLILLKIHEKKMVTVDIAENALRALIPIQKICGSQHSNAKLNEEQVAAIKQLIAADLSCNDIAKKYNVSQRLIYNIKKGLAWKHVI